MVLFSPVRATLTVQYPVTPKLLFVVCLTGLALIFWCLEQAEQRYFSVRHPLPCLLIALFLLWVVVSCIFSIIPAASFFGTSIDGHGALLYFSCGILAFLVLQHIDSPQRLMTLARVLVISGAAVAVVALSQSCYAQLSESARALWGTESWMILQGGGALGNPDFTGVFLAPLCVLAAGLALMESRIRVCIAYSVALCLMGAAVVMTQSRSAYLALLCAALLLVVLMVLIRRNSSGVEKFKWGVVLLAGVCSLGLGLAVTGAQFSTLQNKVLPATTQTVNTYSGSRLTLWGRALVVWAARPLVGTGPDLYQKGTYHIISKVADPKFGDRVYNDDPHSYPLMLAATLGLPALLILLILGTIGICTLGRTLRQKPGNKKQFIYLVFWCAFFAAGLACCFTNANIMVSATAAVLGAAVLVAANQKILLKESAFLPVLLTIIALVLFIAGAVCALKPLKADYYRERSRVTGSGQMLQKAIDEMPWDFKLQEEMVVSLSKQIVGANSLSTYQSQSLDLDAYLVGLNKQYPFELGYLLMRDDLFLDAISRKAESKPLSTYDSILDAQIAQYPKLIDLKLMKSELLFYQGNTKAALSLLAAQPPSVYRDGLRLNFLLDSGQVSQAQTALTSLKRDWPSSGIRDSFTTNAERKLNEKLHPTTK